MSGSNGFSEDDVISLIMGYLDHSSFGERLGKGDDARDIIPRGPRIVFSMDGYSVESVKLPWRNISDVGWCSITSTASDLVSKGAIPDAFMVSIGFPPTIGLDYVRELYAGVREACNFYGCRLMGGDTNRSKDPWISVAGIGFTSGAHPPRRDGALDGDVVVVTGYYGAMGVVSLDGLEEAGKLRWVIEATRRPVVYTRLAYIVSSYSKAVHASMDVSDGLAYTLYTIAVSSDKCIELNGLPAYYGMLRQYCRGDRECITDRILYGGEEYGVVLTVDPKYAGRFIEELDMLEIPYRVVGRVRECREPSVRIYDRIVEPMRWDQFLGWVSRRITR